MSGNSKLLFWKEINFIKLHVIFGTQREAIGKNLFVYKSVQY